MNVFNHDASVCVPHTKAMLFVDRFIHFDETTNEAVVNLTLERNGPYWNYEDGTFFKSHWLCEFMSQAVAAYFYKYRKGTPSVGYLISIDTFTLEEKLPVNGDVLECYVKLTADLDPFGAYDCKVHNNGESIATASMKYYYDKEKKH